MSEPQYGFTQNYYTKYFVSMLLFLNLSLCTQLLLAFSSKFFIKQQAKKRKIVKEFVPSLVQGLETDRI